MHNIREGVLELCVLKLIQQDDLYGYETIRKFYLYRGDGKYDISTVKKVNERRTDLKYV